MELNWEGKASDKNIISKTPCVIIKRVSNKMGTVPNKLIFGENLLVMQTLRCKFHLKNKVDLVYIDPPFSTNTIFKHGRKRTATVSSSNEDQIAYDDTMIGREYLEFMQKRLILTRELMAPHASIYVHIDCKVGHYLKVLMDEIFGKENFRNDITRIKCNPKNFARKGFSNIKDVVLFYTKSKDFVWNEPRQEMLEEDLQRLFPKVDSSGSRYTTTPLHAPGETENGKTGKPWRGMLPPKGRHWRCDPDVLDELDRQGLIEWSKTGNPRKIIYADRKREEGKRIQDIWKLKDHPYPDYPTQKNIELLKLIIQTSSNAGQLVLDCFCGSGTTLLAAELLGRNWIGIDSSPTAINITRSRLEETDEGLFGCGYVYYEQSTNNIDREKNIKLVDS